ncbi:Aste57867_16948 [Aphanomyces stellatus]|uniref:Aste57867_16948 protein n=1 Tax=Aphanomyces stellatus TaxID=120398 RepID=A0A485L6M7_9STRA|nr:hypothetical protein As57867_016890 [Aphanomyces stellatus]VFT93710.1 Aste57867_16948 [Aphanomyces stellatus]
MSAARPPAPAAAAVAPSPAGLNVRVTVRYPAPANAKVPDVLALFRSATWVNVMIRYIVPYLKTSTPANRDVVNNLPAHLCDEGEDCVICMSAMSNAVTLPCGHHFHADCIDAWLRLRSTCPTCRHQIQNAFSGRYAFKGINTALVIDDLDPKITADALQRIELGGRVLKAVVRIAMIPVTHVPELEKFPCELNAMVMTGNNTIMANTSTSRSSSTSVVGGGPSPAAIPARISDATTARKLKRHHAALPTPTLTKRRRAVHT